MLSSTILTAAPNATAALFGSIFQYAPYIVLLILGLALGFYIARPVPVARKISHAIKKGHHIQFLGGYDSGLRVVEYDTGLTGYLHEESAGIDMMPDSRGVEKFYGTTASWATAHSVSNFNPKFEEYVRQWREAQEAGKLDNLEAATGLKIGASAQNLARALYDLQKKRREAREVLDEFNKWQANEITLAELINKKGLTNEEGKKFTAEMELNAADKGETLKARIKALDEAGEIRGKEEWEVEMRMDKYNNPKYSLVRIVKHNIDDLWNFIPTSANMLAVRTMVERAIQIRARENSEMNKTLVKYLGPVMLILSICIGAAVIFSVLK
jgi:hypothetical protein